MQLERRKFLGSTAALAAGGFTGCSEDDQSGSEDEGENGGGSGPTEEQQSLSLETFNPQPQVVSTDTERQSADRSDFIAEIQNSGTDGDVGLTLVWLENQNSDPWSTESEKVTSRERYYDEDERREISITAERSDEYDAFGFRLWAAEITAEIENPGGDTRIDVMLLDGDEVLDEAELDVDSGETVSHTFERDFSDVKPEDIRVEAEPIE